MKQTRASIRYAKALIQLSIEKECLDESYKDMLLINTVCVENKELITLLKSPIIKSQKKLEILNKIFNNKISEMIMGYIIIITNKKRESLIPQISHSFINQYKKHNKIAEAVVVSANKISQKLKERVIKYVEEQGAKKVEVREIIDEKIIGGAIIRIGDKQLDLSIANEISELRQMFNKNLYIQDY